MAASDLYGWFPTMSQPLTAAPTMWNIPERTGLPVNQDPTAALNPKGLLASDFSAGPLSQLAFEMAGKPKRPPFAGSNLPPGAEPSSDSSGDGALTIDPAVIGGGIRSVIGGGASAISPFWNPSGTQAPLDPGMSVPSGSNAPAPSSSGSALSDIGGGILGAYNIYSGLQQGGQQGTGQALIGAGQLSGAVASGASGSALGGALAASGASTALPLAGLGFIAADVLNHSLLGNASKDRNTDAYKAATGATQVTLPMGKAGANYMVVPNMNGSGYQLVSTQDWNNLAGSWYGATYAPDGNQSDWQAKYDNFAKNLQPAKLPNGYSFDASTGKIMYRGKVAGNYGG